jgi:hypothetical protein
MWACMLFQHIEAAGAGDGVFYKQERFNDHSMGGMADQTVAWALSVSCSIKKKVKIFRTLHASFACSCPRLYEVLLIREVKEFFK